jgi:universal stress protein E
MVAVQALDSSSNALLQKAAKLARTRKCTLHLVHVIALPYAPAVSRRATLQHAAQDIIADCKKRLLKVAASPRLRGIRTSETVIWDYPAADGLVRLVLKHRPELLLVEQHSHSRLARPFLSNTDWELIRNCPCPLWLSKSARSTPGPVVAAVDPLHAHAKPASLDGVIVEQALRIAGRPKRVLMCHAYNFPVTPPAIDGAIEAYWALSDRERASYEAMLRDQLRRLAERTRIPEANRIVAQGDPAWVLPGLVRKHSASVVVMGAVSRSAVQRVFVGHTAERLVDRLACDVLVVKPRGFTTRVTPRPRVIFNLPLVEIAP